MHNKTKKIVYVSGTVVILLTTLLVIKYISGQRYSAQLPGLPDLSSVHSSLREQITSASGKAYRNPTSRNIGTLGTVYHSSVYYDQAVQCYKLAIQRSPGKWMWSYYLGYLKMELGESKDVLEHFSHVTDLDPDNYLALYYTGEAYQNLGLYDEAEKIFDSIIRMGYKKLTINDLSNSKSFSLQTFALFNLAKIYMNTGRLEQSEKLLLKLIGEQQIFGPAYRLLGNVYSNLGDSALGNHYSTRANDLAIYAPPSDPMVNRLMLTSRSELYLLRQIDVAIRSNNLEWALSLCKNALKYLPDSKFLLSKSIRGFLSLGHGEEALLYLDQHLEYFNNDTKELMEIADLLNQKGFVTEAMTYFNRTIQLNAEDPVFQSGMVTWLMKYNNQSEALKLMNELLEKYNENQAVLAKGAFLLLATGQNERASEYFLKLKKLYPSDPQIRKLSAMIAEKEGSLEVALSLYKDAVTADPEDLSLVKYLVNIYLKKKMWKEMMHLVQQALITHPNEPYLLAELGNLLISCPDKEMRDIQKGKEYAERAFIHVSTPVPLRILAGRNLSTAYAMLGERKKAYDNLALIIKYARKEKLPEDYIAVMENQLKQYRATY